jgi:hypothetical protein
VRVFAVAAALVLVTAGSAQAHSAGSHGMVSDVTSASPATIHASVDGEGATTLEVPEGSVVVVDGDAGEPSIRFAGGAVYENTRTSGAPPQWRKVGEGTSWTWHDHRTHWTAARPPIVVRQHPNESRLIRTWTIGGTIDGKPLRIAGAIRWVPESGGLGWQWLLVPILGAMLVYIVYLLVDSRRITRAQRPPATTRPTAR